MSDLLHPLEFRNAWFLLGALSALVIFAAARVRGGRVRFSSLSLLPAERGWRAQLDAVPDALLALAAVALSVALAGPRVPDSDSRIRREGIAIAMVVDTSSSMRALDLAPEERRTRLDVVKDVFVDFVEGRRDDAIGLVSFAGFAETRCPLTLDHRSLELIAADLEIVTRRADDGTAVGDGLGLAVERLRESPARSKVAILLTDGVNNTGVESPAGAAELAEESGVKVYTIGAGTTGMAPVERRSPFTGEIELVPMAVEIDEKTLIAIAEKTGGRYFRATDGEKLRQIYAEIDQLERSEIDEISYARYRDHYALALAIGLLLAVLGWLLRATVWRRLP
jgi:Ca-activated chloride channel family protein